MKTPAHLLVAILAFGCCHAALAQLTVNFNSTDGSTSALLYGAGGARLGNANKVAIGYFDSSFSVGANAGNLASLVGAWHEVSSTAMSPFEPGQFYGTPASVDGLAGTKMYLFAWQTPGNTAPPPDNRTGVTAFGLFSASTWTVSPTSTSTSPQILYSFDVADYLHGGAYSDPTFGPGLMLSSAPEPRAYAAVAGAALFAFAAWRRWQGRRTDSAMKL